MSDFERPRRVNGLSPPYTTAQLSTWVFLPTLVLEFLVFASPLLPLAASIPCTMVFVASAMASTYFAIQAMKTDPADPRLGPEISDCDPNEPTKQCWICDVQVGQKSMHCKFCNKCVDHFDHHCMWLNTCVGRANYLYFFRTMLCINIMLLIHGCIQLALVLDIYLGNGETKSRAEKWFQADATVALVVVICIFLFFDLVALSLIGQLLMFHMKLQREGLTTYQFIVQDNQKRRERTKRDQELKQLRQMEVVKAQEEGRTLDVFQLHLGGQLRSMCGLGCCDPLIPEADGVRDPKDRGNGTSNGSNAMGLKNQESKEPEDS